jgi:hypothetical protein
MKTLLKSVLASALLSIALVGQVTAGEEAAIEKAVQDYVSSIYLVKPELLDGSVSPRLQKVGYMPGSDGGSLEENWMDFQALKDLAGQVNSEGVFDPENSPREVTILHHTDLIANVQLKAAWGIDYIHLSKHSGEWMIMNVIWQMQAP